MRGCRRLLDSLFFDLFSRTPPRIRKLFGWKLCRDIKLVNTETLFTPEFHQLIPPSPQSRATSKVPQKQQSTTHHPPKTSAITFIIHLFDPFIYFKNIEKWKKNEKWDGQFKYAWEARIWLGKSPNLFFSPSGNRQGAPKWLHFSEHFPLKWHYRNIFSSANSGKFWVFFIFCQIFGEIFIKVP